MRASSFVLVGVLVGAGLLLGCPPTSMCNEGFVWDGTRCRATTDAGTDVPEADAGPCGMACTGLTPFCDETSGTCVECLGATDCTAPDLACVAGECVACDDNADCTEVDASLCDTAANTCGGCAADPDCEHLAATPVCDEASNTCVACTADTEAARCGANSCDPVTSRCTSTPRMSVTTCGACVSDTECRNANDRCVPMEFMGGERPGGYCLPQFDLGCARPYTSRTPDRTSLSGAVAEAYCGIDEATTTCEAVLDLVNDESCTTDDECGAAGVMDGRCETVGGVANRCTYSCMAAAQCVGTFGCPAIADTYCGAT